MATIVIADDNRSTTDTLAKLVERRGHRALGAYDGATALLLIESETVDVVITDLKMPQMDGLSLLKTIRERWPETMVIVVTAHGSIEIAVAAMKGGAFDFVSKPLDYNELWVKLEKAIIQRELALRMEKMTARVATLEAENNYRYGMGEIIGCSPPMQQIYEIIAKVAPTDSAVLITGESGTGKELVARAIHQRSSRADKPFIPVHCAAFASGVLESELFGHERGAFTGAEARKIGRFELADKGSFFLDEVGEIPLAVQVKLLRVLQEREFERVGGTKSVKTDIRVISATNKNLLSAIEGGLFREDLYYRLTIFTIHLPPLRERQEDIPRLIEYFLRKETSRHGKATPGLTAPAIKVLTEYHWPGNIRELQNVIERAVVMADGQPIDIPHLPQMLSPHPKSYVLLPQESIDFDREMDNFERRLLEHAFEQAEGNKARAAKLLGIDRNRFRNKLKKYDMDDE